MLTSCSQTFIFGCLGFIAYARFGFEGHVESRPDDFSPRSPHISAEDMSSNEGQVSANPVIEENVQKISDLEKKISNLEENAAELETKYQDEKKKNSYFEKNHNEPEKKIRGLKNKISCLIEKIDELEKENLDQSSLNERVRDQYYEKEQAKQKELDEADQQLKQLKQKNQSLEEALQDAANRASASQSAPIHQAAYGPSPPPILPITDIKKIGITTLLGRKARVEKQKKSSGYSDAHKHVRRAQGVAAEAAKSKIESLQQALTDYQDQLLIATEKARLAKEAEEAANALAQAAAEEKRQVEERANAQLQAAGNWNNQLEADSKAFRTATEAEFKAGMQEIARLQEMVNASQSKIQAAEKRAQRAERAEQAANAPLREAMEEIEKLKEELEASKAAAREAQEDALNARMECDLNHGSFAIVPEPFPDVAPTAPAPSNISAPPRNFGTPFIMTNIPGLSLMSGGASVPASSTTINPPAPPRNSGIPFTMSGMANLNNASAGAPAVPAPPKVSAPPRNYGTPFTMVAASPAPVNQPQQSAPPFSWTPTLAPQIDFGFNAVPASTAPAPTNNSMAFGPPTTLGTSAPPARPHRGPVGRRNPTTRPSQQRSSLLSSSQSQVDASIAQITNAFRDDQYDPNKPFQG